MRSALSVSSLGQGPNLVLIHGWGFNQAVWQSWLPYLTPYFRVHCVDLPGFGCSEWQGNAYEKEVLMQNLAACLPDQAHYLGWSMGGLIALQFANVYPQRVLNYVAIASTPKLLAADDWGGVDAHVLNDFGQQLAQDPMQTLRRFFAAQCLQLPEETWRPLFSAIQSHGESNPAALAATLRLLHETDLRQALKQLHCPALHIFGRLDALIPIKLSDWLTQVVPQHQIEILPHAAHLPFLSEPDYCAERIRDFCYVVR